MPKLIVFAGLPGTGKTTLARLLATRLGAVILNKDEVRAALFAPADVDYSSEQNDLCMEMIYQLCRYHLRLRPDRPVIIDGRTYSKKKQVEVLVRAVELMQCQLDVIECVCSVETALTRLKHDEGQHLAGDRNAGLYQQVRANAEPLAMDRLVIETDQGTKEEHLEQIVKHVMGKRKQTG